MYNTRSETKVIKQKILRKNIAEAEQQYWEGLLVAAEYKRMEEVNRGQKYLEANY
jgi:hypothetical protein